MKVLGGLSEISDIKKCPLWMTKYFVNLGTNNTNLSMLINIHKVTSGC